MDKEYWTERLYTIYYGFVILWADFFIRIIVIRQVKHYYNNFITIEVGDMVWCSCSEVKNIFQLSETSVKGMIMQYHFYKRLNSACQ